jgi:inosine-uridine nucleoside N-ribohydrolase
VQLAPVHRIIFDTDFALPPEDDGLALALALNSPELDIVGITTVAGNYNVRRANADVLRMLEIAGREDLRVYPGASRPLKHEKDAYAMAHYGRWWSDEPPPPPPGGFASKSLEQETAADFMVRAVMHEPGQLEIVAIGPLTNLATAIGLQPRFARAVKHVTIMGGAIAALPDGAGNVTPNAEFNFWVDPEAAQIVLRSGMSIQLSPLNVSRKTAFNRASFDRLIASATPFARLIEGSMAPLYQRDPAFHPHMYDEVAVGSLVDPTVIRTRSMIVDVDIHHGIDYGVSVGGVEPWPRSSGARTIDVQYEIDNDRFMRLFVDRLSRASKPRP